MHLAPTDDLEVRAEYRPWTQPDPVQANDGPGRWQLPPPQEDTESNAPGLSLPDTARLGVIQFAPSDRGS